MLRKSYLVFVAGAVAVLLLAFMISGTLAEESDPPAFDQADQADSGACLPYYVTVDSANVRACALLGCRVVEQVERNTSLCVLGEASDSAEWLQVDLDPANAASPIYFINTQVVAPGAPGQARSDIKSCQSWLVSDASTTVYACSTPGCSPLGTLLEEDWLCGHYYTVFPDWVYAVDSDRSLAGWVQRKAVIPWGSNTGQPVPFEPTSAPADATGAVITAPRETPRPTVTPPTGPITIAGQLPACQQYYVSSVEAQVRECAGANCPLVDTLTLGDGVCIRGVTGNPDWLIVSLTSDETTASLYAIETSKITLGRASGDVISAVYANCPEYWSPDVTGNVNLRQCPSDTCPVLDTIEQDSWVCVQDYGGAYEDWLRADVPGGLAGVWINADVMIELTGDALPFAVAQASTPTPTAPAIEATNTPTRTPTAAAAQAEAAAPTCIPYVVSVSGATGANVRSCPSIACDVVETIPQGTQLCVLGLDPEDSNWLVVDRAPEDAGSPLVYISSEIAAPQSDPAANAVGLTPQAAAQVVLPSVTPLPTLPVCEPGSALANCVTMTPTAVLTPLPENVPTGPLLAQEVTLADLNIPNIEMISPIGSSQFTFYVPDDWVPAGNNVLYLDLEYSQTTATAQPAGLEYIQLVTTLDVYMDNQLIATVNLGAANVGAQTLAVPIPVNLLALDGERDHLIRLQMRAEEHCLLNGQSKLFIRSDKSYFHVEFRAAVPVLDLSLYPRPFYNQRFVNQSEILYMVLPDAPTAADLEVAASLAAGLGDLTFNDLGVRVTTAATLDEATRRTHNLMLIGEIETNSLIKAYYEQNLFPSTLSSDGVLAVAGDPVATTDGVVQIMPNPDNEQLAVLAVTGQTPEAVTKAAQSLAGRPSPLGSQGQVAVVTDILPVVRPPVGFTLESQVTFAELGYPIINMGGYGTSTSDIRFYLPASYKLTEEAYIDLEFNYSDVLRGGRATVALIMNGSYPIASTYLESPDTPVTGGSGEITPLAGGPYHLRARIPAEAVRPGDQNVLTIVVSVGGDWNCYPPDEAIAWFTVSGNSLLKLPRARIDVSEVQPVIGSFPVPFNTQPDLRDVWLSLSDDPETTEIEQMLRIAARLGMAVDNGEGFMPRVSMGALPSGVDLSGYNMIVFGRNSTNSFLATLNNELPQPFKPGTDELMQVLDNVVFRLPLGYEIGLIELLPAPWSLDRVIMIITGTGPTGQANAAAALSDFLYGRTQLLGDVAYVTAQDVSTIDTRTVRHSEDLAEEIQDAIAELDMQATQVAQSTLDAQTAATALAQTPEAVQTTAAQAIVPTLTLVPTLTPGPTFTPTAFLADTTEAAQATPFPTFAPLAPEVLEPSRNEVPKWFGGLLLAALVLLVVTVIFGMLRMIRGSNNR